MGNRLCAGRAWFILETLLSLSVKMSKVMSMSDGTVLVVGGAGYIGSHMVKALLDQGINAIILDNLATGYQDLVLGGEFFKGDLGDAQLLDRIFSSRRVDAVMHFAACSLVGESVRDPLKYYRNNVARTVELLQAMQRHQVRRFIFSSTAAVYGEPKRLPIVEDDPQQPSNPYGASKVAVERMLADCDRAFGLKSICLRYFNAAGADPSGRIGERHQPESHLIPLVLRVALGSMDRIRIFGADYDTPDGTCVRDYIHVNDLSQAHLLALKALMNGAQSNRYNLGNSRGHSVREVIDTARRVTGHAIPELEEARRPGDPASLVADSGRARSQLGWKPAFENLEEIIATAWNWHQKEAAS